MFKVLDDIGNKITLRHVPDGHLYIFRVRAIDGRHFVDLGEMADNASAFSPAYKYSQQARVFAAEVVREWDYRLALPPYGPPERPSSQHHRPEPASEPDRPSFDARPISPNQENAPSSFAELLRWCFWLFVFAMLVRHFFF